MSNYEFKLNVLVNFKSCTTYYMYSWVSDITFNCLYLMV